MINAGEKIRGRNLFIFGFVVLLTIPTLNGVGMSQWNTINLDFNSGDWNNTETKNGDIILANNSGSYNSWSEIQDVCGPPPRNQQSMTYDSTNGVDLIYGGSYYDSIYNDCWTYNLSTNSWSIRTRIPDASEIQGSLTGQAMAFNDHSDTTVMFGGTDGNNYWGWTYIYNYTANIWIQRYQSIIPEPRKFHSMVYDTLNDRFVLFGGRGDGIETFVYYNDTWTYDQTNNTWMNQAPIVAPSPRCGQSMCYDPISGQIILFGGMNDTDIFQDTWTYNLTSNVWTNRTSSTHPAARTYAAMAMDPSENYVILFGGQNTTSMFDDTWEYNTGTNLWEKVLVDNPPSSRSYPTMTYDNILNRLFLFGGLKDNGQYMDDYWIFDPINNSWSKLGELSSPMPRSGACTTFDSINNVGILFGGYVTNRSYYPFNLTSPVDRY